MKQFTIEEIRAKVEGRLIGRGDAVITGVAGIEQALPGQITFIGDESFAAKWPASRGGAALIGEKIAPALEPGKGRSLIRVPDAELAVAIVLNLFAPPAPDAGFSADAAIHPSALVDSSAKLGTGVRIGAHCIVGPGVVIGDRTTLYPNVMIFDDAQVGCDCVFWPNVVIRERCVIGDRCLFHPNVSIGADGFGFRPGPGGKGLVKIPQIGHVEIGDDVEIGANSCVDRGKFGPTVIGTGTKIDNQCQIGHNCRIGRYVILVAQVGLAGSVTVGDGAVLGGKVGVGDHLTIGAGAMLAAMSAVMTDVPPGKKYAGMPALEARQTFRVIACVHKLPELMKGIEAVLEKERSKQGEPGG